MNGYKFIRIVKRGMGKIVMVSKDGKTWKSPEEVFGLEGDFDLTLDLDADQNMIGSLAKEDPEMGYTPGFGFYKKSSNKS